MTRRIPSPARRACSGAVARSQASRQPHCVQDCVQPASRAAPRQQWCRLSVHQGIIAQQAAPCHCHVQLDASIAPMVRRAWKSAHQQTRASTRPRAAPSRWLAVLGPPPQSPAWAHATGAHQVPSRPRRGRWRALRVSQARTVPRARRRRCPARRAPTPAPPASRAPWSAR